MISYKRIKLKTYYLIVCTKRHLLACKKHTICFIRVFFRVSYPISDLKKNTVAFIVDCVHEKREIRTENKP